MATERYVVPGEHELDQAFGPRELLGAVRTLGQVLDRIVTSNRSGS